MTRKALLGVAFVAVLGGAAASDLEAQTASGPEGAVVSGTVRGGFQGSSTPLGGAFVDVRTADRRFTVETDPQGRYVVSGLSAGPVALRVDHPGHHPVDVTVRAVAGRVVNVDLVLTAAPLRLAGVDVRARRAREPGVDEEIASATGPRLDRPDPELEVRMLEISPSLGETGLVEAVQGLPGNDPTDPTDVLFMRGSTTDLKLVLLDGIPVFTPFHVAGLLRSFEPTVLGSADLHVGGAPARYDGGLTHILDLRTRVPRRDRVRATGSVDLLSASAATEVPLGGRAALLASARSLHDLGRAPLGGERPYGYGDVLVKVEGEPADDHRLRATGFWNGESVRLDFADRPSDAHWSNRAASVGYETEVAGAALRMIAGGSRYEARLPLQPSATEEEPDPSAILASATSDRRRAEVDVAWHDGGSSLRAGVSAERIEAAFAAESMSGPYRSESFGSATSVGGFVETTRPLAPELTVRAGLRGDVFSGDGGRLSPRVALFWSLGPEAILSIAAGRYHQVTRTPDSRVDETLEAYANDAATPDDLLPVATADHVVLSLEQRLAGSVSLGLEGFWKRFDGLAGARGETVRNSGLEVRVLTERESGAVWLGYGLSWFWSPTDFSGATTDFAGRHLLSAGVSGALVGRLRGEARVAYGAGLPSTSLPFGSVSDAMAPEGETLSGEQPRTQSVPRPPVPSLDESFLRVDLEVHAVFEPDWGPGTWRVRPYLRLLNALDRRDSLFYTYQPWRPDSVTPLAERPILPVLGIAFSF